MFAFSLARDLTAELLPLPCSLQSHRELVFPAVGGAALGQIMGARWVGRIDCHLLL